MQHQQDTCLHWHRVYVVPRAHVMQLHLLPNIVGWHRARCECFLYHVRSLVLAAVKHMLVVRAHHLDAAASFVSGNCDFLFERVSEGARRGNVHKHRWPIPPRLHLSSKGHIGPSQKNTARIIEENGSKLQPLC